MTERPCTVYLVRHGRTVLNVEIRFRGRLEIPLDEQGRKEAWVAAHLLGAVGPEAVYTSPLARAREVAAAISSVTGARIADHPALVNLDYGEWEGLTKAECARRDPELWRLYRESPEDAACPGGEALAAAADRVVAALRWIGSKHPGAAVAAVSHGVMLRLAVLRADPDRGGDWEVALPTGSAAVFEVLDGDVSLVALPGDAAAAPPDPPERLVPAFLSRASDPLPWLRAAAS
jgi:ribonuclease H / adenosylcobalamin/alpha-ribazole phosphatase